MRKPPSTQTATAESRLFTIKQSALYMNCHVWYVRTQVWARAIPHVRFGKRILIDKADLARFIDKQKQVAA